MDTDLEENDFGEYVVSSGIVSNLTQTLLIETGENNAALSKLRPQANAVANRFNTQIPAMTFIAIPQIPLLQNDEASINLNRIFQRYANINGAVVNQRIEIAGLRMFISAWGAKECNSFDTPDVVPIDVGCALALLVLVVLAAYLIGRRRSQNRGYLSM